LVKSDSQRENSFAKESSLWTLFQKPIRCEKAQAGEGLAYPHTSSKIVSKEFFEGAVCLPESSLSGLLAEQKK